LLQWLASRTIGSGLIDNGRLDSMRFGWVQYGTGSPAFALLLLLLLALHLHCSHAQLQGRLTVGCFRTCSHRPSSTTNSWLVWASFLAYFVTGGFFNLLMVSLGCSNQNTTAHY